MDKKEKQITIRRTFLELIVKLTSKEYKEFTSQDLRNIKEVRRYLIKYPEDQVTKDILEAEAEYIRLNILNLDFIKALYMSDELKYKKKHEMIRTLPLMNKKDILFFNGINHKPENYGNMINFYKGCFELLAEQNRYTFSEVDINKIINFVENNKDALLYAPQKYNKIDKEIELYKKASINYYTEDYEDFKKLVEGTALLQGKYADYNDTQDHYSDKKLNNIAEQYIFNCLNNMTDTEFISRDLTDGLGYDIYCTTIEDTKKEVLIEVKAFIGENNKEFSLNEKEFKTMIEALANSNVKYIICLSYIDLADELKIQNVLLEANGPTKFIDINSSDEYCMDFWSNIPTFKLNKEKVKQKKII